MTDLGAGGLDLLLGLVGRVVEGLGLGSDGRTVVLPPLVWCH